MSNDENENEKINAISAKLLIYQVPHLFQMYETFKESSCVLDASDTGTGKTYTTIALAKLHNLKPFVICPKCVITSWHNVAKYFDVELLGISNYELLKGGKYYRDDFKKTKCPHIKINLTYETVIKNGKPEIKTFKSFEFNFPHNALVIFDEAHRCKNHASVTSQILQAVIKCKCKILLLSATICDKIECFKPFGMAFGFYDNLKQYKWWMKNQIKIRKLEFASKHITDDDDKQLLIINDRIFPIRGSRMKIADLGDLFPQNNIICQSYFCKNYEEIQEEYEFIEEMFQKLKNAHETSNALGKIVKARQKIEMYKVPIFIDLAEEAIDNNYSLAIFVNFLDTLYALAHHLKAECLVHGGQSLEEREANIDNFQTNKHKIIICIIQAGGVGISLHDIHGGHQRMSLISPTWSGQDIKQVLGRIHRAGSKTPAIQKIVYCSGTYEDRLLEIINQKIKNIDAINDKDLISGKYDLLLLEEDGTLEKPPTINSPKNIKKKFKKKNLTKELLKNISGVNLDKDTVQ